MNMIDVFFESKQNVLTHLVGAITNARIQHNIQADQLDKCCGFAGFPYPKTSEFEKDPLKLTGKMFCRASMALDICIDDVLTISKDDPKLEGVIEEMKQVGSAVTAGCGGSWSIDRIPLKDQAPVYVQMKTIEELG
jgi:hypothetical protein